MVEHHSRENEDPVHVTLIHLLQQCLLASILVQVQTGCAPVRWSQYFALVSPKTYQNSYNEESQQLDPIQIKGTITEGTSVALQTRRGRKQKASNRINMMKETHFA